MWSHIAAEYIWNINETSKKIKNSVHSVRRSNVKTGACCGFERVSIVIHQVHYRNAMLSARLNLAMNGRNQHRLKAPRYPHSLRHMPTIMQACQRAMQWQNTYERYRKCCQGGMMALGHKATTLKGQQTGLVANQTWGLWAALCTPRTAKTWGALTLLYNIIRWKNNIYFFFLALKTASLRWSDPGVMVGIQRCGVVCCCSTKSTAFFS